jgi:4-hydroxybenzoate polyprenyltransferase
MSSTSEATASTGMGRLRLYLDLIRWDRPAGWLLLLWPTLSALWMAAKGFPGWPMLGVFVAGTVLMRSAGCCVNDVADRDFDKHVKRTANRPVTRGAVSPKEALLVGSVLALAAFALVLTTNAATVLWSFAALGVAILYPFAKRVVSMPQAVLGVAFSLGIPMAFAAVLGKNVWSWPAMRDAVPSVAWLLLAANLFWVLAYDTIYAMVDRDDDAKLNIRTSAMTLGRWDVAAVMWFHAVHLLAWLGLGLHLGLGGWFVAGILAAGVIVLGHAPLVASRARDACFRAFARNHWVGCAIFVGTVVDLWGR